jgi:hypothetical protein
MRRVAAKLVGLILALGISTPACCAAIKSVAGKRGSIIIQVSGGIVPGDGEAFIAALQKAAATGKPIESVQLNSAGGNLGEGAKLATAIKLAKLPTVVPTGAVCASACFLAFAAGEQKFAGEVAFIGVHKASDKGGTETRQSATATALMARFANELGVPSSITRQMVATPPTQVVWLDQRDLHSMGVRTLGVNVQPAQNAPETVIVVPKPAADATAVIVPAKQATDRPPWYEFIERTTALSAQQNEGKAVVRHACQTELKECTTAVAYRLPDGRQALAMTVEDESGKIFRREVCENNASNDVRDCVNWDTGSKYRDAKDAAGTWVQSAAEQ